MQILFSNNENLIITSVDFFRKCKKRNFINFNNRQGANSFTFRHIFQIFNENPFKRINFYKKIKKQNNYIFFKAKFYTMIENFWRQNEKNYFYFGYCNFSSFM